MAYIAGSGGSFTVYNPAGLQLTVAVTTNPGNVATTLYSNATRVTSLGSSALTQYATSTTYYINDNNLYNISVKYLGIEISDTVDGTARVFPAFGDVFLGFTAALDPNTTLGLLADAGGVPFFSMAPESAVSNSTSPAGTGVMYDVPIWLPVGFKPATINFVTATTAMTSPTNAWTALYTPDGATLLGQSVATQATVAANTAYSPAFVADATNMASGAVPYSGFYRAAFMCQGTPPTLQGVSMNNAVSAAAHGNLARQASTSGSALTTTAPSTVASPVASAVKALAWIA